tara:strand:+ start:5115 stop:8132 length:3018 start_codon:yes stop_codon:yes gene_type:complete
MKKIKESPIKRKIIFSFSIVLILFCQNIIGQQNTGNVKGNVTDPNGVSIPFVNIIIKDSNKGTITDIDGNYEINAPLNSILVCSSLGYKLKEIIVDRELINIILEDDVSSLDEVVVVGYGTQKKKDLTGAISLVKNEDIIKRQATTIAETLQGLATGVTVRSSAQPGAEAKIEIRGLKNLQSSNPLYVIDGLISNANRDFNSNDVESIQILKDAAAAAIYGSRAANGVIIITTKKGKEGPLQINFSSKTSFTQVPRYNLAGKDEFVDLNFQAYDNAGIPRANLRQDVDTDWQDATFRGGIMQDHNVSFSGGSKNTSFFVSANYFGNKGTVISTDFNRKSFRVNTSADRGIFSVGENFALSSAYADEKSGNPFVDVVRMLPTIPIYDDRNPGGYGYGEQGIANTFGTNPIALADLSDTSNRNYRLRGNFWAEIKPFEFLKYRLSYGLENSFDEYNYLRKTGNWTLNQPDDSSIYDKQLGKYESQILENTVTFTKEFGKHDVTLLAGTSIQKVVYKNIYGRKRNLPTDPSTGDYFTELGLGDSPVVNGGTNQNNLLSYFGRLEYNYDNKYILNAVMRRDGSSKFSKENKWANFPSISAAWRISNESFFDVKNISDLKLRASYGELGSGNIGDYQYQGFINTNGAIALGTGQTLQPSATQVRLANSQIKWERLIQKNYGLDLAMFNNKLEFTAEYFDAKTEDVLFGFPILYTTGSDGGDPISNAATVSNKGIELSLSYRESINDNFSYNASINFTKLENKLVSLGNGLNESIQGNTITTEGQPVGMWYLLETNGLFQSQSEVNDYKSSDGTTIMPSAEPGDIRYIDYNDDGQITNEDKHVVGNPWPNFEMGLNAEIQYKNFDFSMNWIGSFGADVYNGYRSLVDRFDDDSNYRAGINPWTPENTNTNFPRIVKSSTLNSRGDTNRWLEDGSFIRLKYIGFGYNIPKKALESIGVSNARLTISGQNLITITKYEGLDPEFVNGNIFQRGYDNFAFPNVKTYTLGVNVSF